MGQGEHAAVEALAARKPFGELLQDVEVAVLLQVGGVLQVLAELIDDDENWREFDQLLEQGENSVGLVFAALDRVAKPMQQRRLAAGPGPVRLCATGKAAQKR